MSNLCRALVAVALSAVAAGASMSCGGGSDDPADTGEVTGGGDMGRSDRVCAPGDIKECPCIGGSKGVQTCSDDGSRWGKCEGCPEPKDGGEIIDNSADAASDSGGGDAAVDAGLDVLLDDVGTDGGMKADAASDIGVEDSGGVSDAGGDTGVGADIGSSDAGKTDGGAPDAAGHPDSGLIDSGVADAGSTDGGCSPSCGGMCGGVSDGCGGYCPDNCVPPQSCGGGGTQYVCGCTLSCSGKCGGASNGCGGYCPDPCNGHGTCNAGVCACTAGYADPSCNSCDTGYTGYPVCTLAPGCWPSPSGKGGDMCNVAAGPFWMGCNVAVDTECQSFENPYHQVTVPAFRIDKYEVTVSDYKACVTAGGCAAIIDNNCDYNIPGKESHPINCVAWNQAKAYCAWAGKRLPTEAEWEKAARGTDGRKYPWGNDALDCNRAVQSEIGGCNLSGTAVVGSKPSGVSPYGAADMVGNVEEWVEDDIHETYTGAPADGSAWVDNPRGASRVARGGAWNLLTTPYTLRASNRDRGDPTGVYYIFGFRCGFSAQ